MRDTCFLNSGVYIPDDPACNDLNSEPRTKIRAVPLKVSDLWEFTQESVVVQAEKAKAANSAKSYLFFLGTLDMLLGKDP